MTKALEYHPPPSISGLPLDSPPQIIPWKLNQTVLKNLNQYSQTQTPDELSRRIIQCILKAHHTEIVVPPGTQATNAVDAALLSFIATSFKFKTSLEPSPARTSPMVLVVCLTIENAERHSKACKELGNQVPGIQIDQITHTNSLSTDLADMRSIDPASTSRPLLITTLSRLTLLLFDHRVLSTDRVSILVLDLRDHRSNSLNHHLLAELEPLFNQLGPLVQIVILQDLHARIPPALSELFSQKIEASIRANLTATSASTASTDPTTPPLTSSSLSRAPSNSSSTPTPPINILAPSTINLPFNTTDKDLPARFSVTNHWNI